MAGGNGGPISANSKLTGRGKTNEGKAVVTQA